MSRAKGRPTMYKVILLLHVLSATVWTGGHLLLSITVLPGAFRQRSVVDLLKFESGFETVGIPALIIQVVTGVYMALYRLPDVAMWFDFNNQVARLILLKLTLLLLTALFAVDARLRIIPELTEKNLNALALHIIPVTLISVLFVFVGVSFRTGSLS
jgi:putative copper export protein